ncbi:MAG: ATPase, T2SS/T4P/T4SS family [Dehalococcoidia bacterium]|nr:ATPase, T2SS/T4P/T4SS family [Dehalococcoidia bacterium]
MAASAPVGERERLLREEVREELRHVLDIDALAEPGPGEVERVRRVIAGRIDALNRRSASAGEPPLSDPEGLARRILDEILGLGPLQPLLDDPSVEEIIANGPHRVFAIEGGQKRLTDVFFEDDEELLRLVRRAVGRLGRRLDETSPMVDARLPDGSRLNAVIPPLTSRWTHVTIRKFLLRARTLDDLVGLGTLTNEAASFLEAAVQSGLNVLISGGTGSGKTTCLNALGASIAGAHERVVTIEETAELQLESMLPDCVGLQARLPNVEGVGSVSIRSLVKNALRMRPTRIIVGEVRGAEALDMLSAMNSGHEGSMCTIHANGPRQALSKLRTYAMMAEEALPARSVTEMIAEAIDLVVHLRLEAQSGRRLVASIYEVTGMEEDAVAGSELFALSEGGLRWTGIRPRCAARLVAGAYPWERAPTRG